ncbi:MAG: hypothetical protein MCSN_1830 [Candidatus Microsyncoccus archaeolyticus]|nr:MAG: hypothetical protein MCSN_1830 [Candidatus Parcubacteria bacterium]
MEIKTHEAKVLGEKCTIDLMHFSKSDGKVWKGLFDSWKNLKFGLRDFKTREPNLPEGLSEVAFCLWSGSGRMLKKKKGGASSSFDTFNLKTGKAEQIKASSVEEDLTSFGPKSKWDDIYFLDFYNGGKLDGTFNVYKISNKLIKSVKVNKDQTFEDQQKEKRRPRFSITKDIIKKKKIEPIAKNVKVW